MATEAPPVPIEDKDLVVPLRPATPEEIMQEDDGIREALRTGDAATYFMWYQKHERDLGENPKPVEKAKLLVRAARLFNAVNQKENAVKLLARAAKLVEGRDTETESLVKAFLREVGGEAALDAIKAEDRAALRERNNAIQKELIELGRHDSENAKKFTKEELAAHTAKLRAELQELINKEQTLR